MSKISTYEVTPVPKLADKLIGTSVGGEIEDITYNFTLSELLNLFIPNIPANTLQGILDYGNTATQDIILYGTIYTTNIEVTNTATILDSYLTGETHVTGGLYDNLNSKGTSGQVLRSTGTGIEWYTVPTIIPTLQQVLTSGNTADVNIILSSDIEAITATADNVVSDISLNVNGSFKDKDASVGSAGQVLSSTGTKVQWVNLPVYTATTPLSIDSITRVISIQQANSTQDGYLSSSDWVTFDGKQNNIILTTVGSSGPSTLIGSALNIPNYSEAISGFVPYIGATQAVNLGVYRLTAAALTITGGSGTAGNLTFGQSDAFAIPLNGFSAIDAITTSFSFAVATGVSTYKYFKFETTSLTNNTLRSYTLPDASGTLALISDLTGYVTLATTQTISGAKTFGSSVNINTPGQASLSITSTSGNSSEINSFVGSSLKSTISTSATEFKLISAIDNILKFQSSNLFKASLIFSNTADYSYTFPNATGTIALLQASQTFTGDNEFTGLSDFQNSAFFGQGIYLTKNSVPSTFYSGSLTMYSGISVNKNIIFEDNSTSTQFIFDSVASRVYTFPAASGTIALLENWQTFTGQNTFANNVIIDNGLGMTPISFKQYSSGSTGGSGYTSIYAFGTSNLGIDFGNVGNILLNNSLLTETRQYFFPDADGTLALTSDIPSTSTFVPYTGATSNVTLGAYSLTAASLIKSGGTSAQILAADGSVITAGTNITISGGTISASGGGGSMAIGGAITSATAGSVLFAGAAGVLAQDNANFFWDDTNNRLGIGTVAPSKPITISGSGINSYSGTQILIAPSLDSAGVQLNATGGGGRIYEFQSTTTGTFIFYDRTASAYRFTINSSGFLGLNTTTIGSQLQVNGNAAIGYSASTAAPTNGLAVSGNVGIGNTNSSGTYKVDITGTTAISNTFYLTKGASDTVQLGSSVYLNGGSGSSFTQLQQGVGRFIIFGFNGTAWAETLTINNTSGNVGLGTTTIGSKIQVNGNAAIGYSASTAAPTNGLAVSGDVTIGTSRLLLYQTTPPNAAVSTKMGYMFSTIGTTGSTPAGSFIEDVATGTILSYGVNVPQAGTRNTAYVGGIFRLDTRGTSQEFCVLGYPSGGSVEAYRIGVNLQNGNTILASVAGNVGIGIAAYATIGSKLQVNGNVAIGYSASTAAPTNGLAVSGFTALGTNAATIRLQVSDASTNEIASFDNSGTFGSWIHIFGSATGGKKWRLQSAAGTDGNVGSLVIRNATDSINALIINSTGSLGIGASPVASAALQISSTTQGFLPPTMTSAQKTAIATPATGLIIYQSDGVEGLYIYSGASWKSLTMV